MKLLFVYYVASGGVETLNRIRSEALIERGVNCHLLYQWRGSGLQNTSHLPVHITDDDAIIGYLLDTFQYDAVIVTSNYGMLERIRKLGYKGPLLYEAQGLGAKQTAHYELIAAIPYIGPFCNAILYPRTAHLMELFQLLYPGIRQHCLDNPVDSNRFCYRAVPPPSHPVLGWIGRIEPNKNWQRMLQIASGLIQANPAFRVWTFEDDLLGESDQKYYFEQTVQDLGLSPYLTRYKNIPHRDMAVYLSMIGDCGGFLLSTSVSEGFGYAVAEAMCCRCPVIATDSDGVKSLIIHNITGKMISHADTAEPVQEAMELWGNHQLRESIRYEALQHVKHHFSVQQYCEHFLNILQECGITRY